MGSPGVWRAAQSRLPEESVGECGRRFVGRQWQHLPTKYPKHLPRSSLKPGLGRRCLAVSATRFGLRKRISCLYSVGIDPEFRCMAFTVYGVVITMQPPASDFERGWHLPLSILRLIPTFFLLPGTILATVASIVASPSALTPLLTVRQQMGLDPSSGPWPFQPWLEAI
ncbi:hypothetical protein BJX62DRAFT_38656 [Aspergillus germanicus]